MTSRKTRSRKVAHSCKQDLAIDSTSYLGLFTVESWREFKDSGSDVMGFTEKKWTSANKLVPGDRILCYLTKVSAFVAVMRVTGPAYRDDSPIWSDGTFPVRIPVTIEVERRLTEAVPIGSLRDKLSIFKGKSQTGWTVHVRTSPRRWSNEDAKVVIDSLRGPNEVTSSPRKITTKRRQPPSKSNQKIPPTLRVGRIVKKTIDLQKSEATRPLGSYDNVLSGNKVTGYSVNVPIANTCRPSAVCIKTCYFAAGAPSWLNSLRHQRKVYDSICSDPHKFAERVALEYDRLELNFLRWNGGGDLFPESIEAINYLAEVRPDITLWVVTRIPEMAAELDDRPNVFIHFSLDAKSLRRRDDFLALKPKSKNFFFSYQADENEEPTRESSRGVSVLFFNNYRPQPNLEIYEKEVICPLNESEDIAGVCESCRRCFDGTAVEHQRISSSESQ
jgi:hypothetical protein